MGTENLRFWAAANLSNEEQEKIRTQRAELEEEEEIIKQMPNHGAGVGFREMMSIANHPVLIEFFEKAEETLELNENEARKLQHLKQLYTLGELDREQIEELENIFFEPYIIKIIQREKKRTPSNSKNI